MKTEAITYNQVVKQIQEMADNGEKITVRNVRMRTGGTNAKIAEFVRQWNEEQMIDIHDDNFSESLKIAIINDRNSAVDKAVTSYQSQLAESNNLFKETQGLLAEKEDIITKLTMELETIKTSANVENTKLSLKIDGLEKLQSELKGQAEDLQNKLEKATNEKHNSDKLAAVWESKYNELKEQLKK